MKQSSDCLVLLEQLYLVSYMCIYLRYLLDKSILLVFLQVFILYILTLVGRLFEENETTEDEWDIIKLLILKCLRMLQLLIVVTASYCILLRYVDSIPHGRLVTVLFIGEFDDGQHDTDLYRYKICCLIYVLDIILLVLPLLIISIIVNESFQDVPLNRGPNETIDQIDKVLQSFVINTREKYGILTLLGMNLFANRLPSIYNENDINNSRRTNDYGSIVS